MHSSNLPVSPIIWPLFSICCCCRPYCCPGPATHGARAARAGALAQLLARLVPALSGRGPGGAEAGALATMALEVATALTNPAIALDPGMPAPQRAREECPPCAEARAPPPAAGPLRPVICAPRGPRACAARRLAAVTYRHHTLRVSRSSVRARGVTGAQLSAGLPCHFHASDRC